MSLVNESADSKRMNDINHQMKSVTAKPLKKWKWCLTVENYIS